MHKLWHNQLFLLLFIFLNFISLSSFADPIFKIDNGSNQQINKFSNCKVVTNNSGKSIMVPTNTSGEWSAFLAHLPAGVTATATCTFFHTTIGTACNNAVTAIALQPDGKILLGGQITYFNGSAVNQLIRLNSDGTRDSTLNTGTGFEAYDGGLYSGADIEDLRVLANGTIIVAGNAVRYNSSGSNNASHVVELNSTGVLGIKINDADEEVRSIDIDLNGNFLVAGTSLEYGTQSHLVRSLSSGANDASFTMYYKGSGASFQIVRAQPSDGKVILGGVWPSGIVRLTTSGTVDSTFNIGTGFNSGVYALAIQSDGKVLVGGNFSSYNGSARNGIIRLNSDGSIDPAFSIGTGLSTVLSLAIQSDGKIVVGGNFTSYNGTTQNNITRLNSDGTRDTGFNIGTGFNNQISSLAIQSDGKIVVGGNFTSYNGTTQNHITRLNSDGSID